MNEWESGVRMQIHNTYHVNIKLCDKLQDTYISYVKYFVLHNRNWEMQLVIFFLMILTHTYADYPALKAVLSEKGLRDGKFFTCTWKSLQWLHLYIIFTLSQSCTPNSTHHCLVEVDKSKLSNAPIHTASDMQWQLNDPINFKWRKQC